MLSYRQIAIFIIIGLQIILSSSNVCAQFSPQANYSTSNAIYKDSSVFKEWATHCVVHRGYINMQDTNATYNGSNRASFGTAELALGKPGGVTDVVSLGDKGYAILSFDFPIKDSIGYDFAVFENGILNHQDSSMAFLELAFVEVSSDSIHFVRFPAVSLIPTSTQVSTFAYLDASLIHNLAGKYIVNYGTPFDLNELKDSDYLDINNVRWIKIIDLGGCIDKDYASYDANRNIINDPFPTPFNTCGFDLDAVGVINVNYNFNKSSDDVVLWPNPVTDYIRLYSQKENIKKISIYNLIGKLMLQRKIDNKFTELEIPHFEFGIYFIIIDLETKKITKKILIENF